MKLTIRNKKDELLKGYISAQEEVQQLRQQQRVLFGVAGILIVMWLV